MGFRLPPRSLDNIDFLIQENLARNATEAVITALEYFAGHYRRIDSEKVTEEKIKDYLTSEDGKRLLKEICKSQEVPSAGELQGQ